MVLLGVAMWLLWCCNLLLGGCYGVARWLLCGC